jgi:hypothetical protein
MRIFAFLLLGGAVACAEQLPGHIELQPAGENVEFAMDAPSPRMYTVVGLITAEAAAKDLDTAQTAARNDLRNKAAALGASLVTIDQDLGEPLLFEDKTRVKLIGRAFKATE